MSIEAFYQALAAGWPYKLVLITILSSFMGVTAIAFVRGRVQKKQAEYDATIRFLGVSDAQGRFADRAVINEYPWRSYIVPVTSATLVTVFGLISLLFAAELVEDTGRRSVILSALFEAAQEPSEDLRWQSMVVLTMAFLGAYIWSCHSIVRRLVAGDLAPIEYFNTSLRLILAPLLSLMVAFLFQASGMPTALQQSLPVIAFMTGMLPGAVLLYLEEKVAQLLKFSERGAPDLPLGMIEGLNRFHAVRLGEVGIDNAQNLAEANIVELILKTPFNANQLIDWIAQARLYVYAKDDLAQLRRFGVRSAFDLIDMAGDQAQIATLAKLAEMPEPVLATIAQRLHTDPAISRLADFRLRLAPEMQAGRPQPQSPVRVA
jgi:hypothetical protein